MKFVVLMIAITMFLTGCDEEAANIKKFPSFVAKDLNGREFSNTIFKDVDVTAVVILKLDSQICINLLSKLCTLREINNTQIITLTVDKNVSELSADYSNDFVNLIVNDDFNELLLNIHNVPTTIFVDSECNIIGQAVIGDNVDLIHHEMMHLLEINSPDSKNLKFIQDKIF